MTIKTYNSNWEFFEEGRKILSICTDSDNINAEVYSSLQEIASDFFDRLEEAGHTCTEEEKQEITTLCNIYFTDRI